MAPVIVLYEPIHPRGMQILQSAGEIVIPTSLEEEALLPLFAKADAAVLIVTGSVTRRLMQNAPRLRVVGRNGAGVDNVDVQAATDLGVWVVNTPDAPSESVAEHFILLALALARNLREAERALYKGDWGARKGLTGIELRGRTIGIIGFGNTGRLIAKKCSAAFDSPILYYDVVRADPAVEREYAAAYVPLDVLLAQSDFVTLQVPLTSDTRHMISADDIALMKPDAYLLNLSRGPVWDEGALLRALIERRIAGAATDVFEVEPPSRTGQTLLQLNNFVATPHIAGNTAEAMERMSLVAEDVVRVLGGNEPRHAVNHPPRLRGVPGGK